MKSARPVRNSWVLQEFLRKNQVEEKEIEREGEILFWGFGFKFLPPMVLDSDSEHPP